METLLLEPIAAPSIPVLNVEEVIANAKKKVSYLKEGVTGKQLTKLRIAGNKASKEETMTISFAITQVKKHSQDYLNSFEDYNEADLVPWKLLPFKKESEAKNGKFSPWLITLLVARMYKA